MNLSRLFEQDQQDDRDSAQEARRLTLRELGQVQVQLEMFDVPLWGYLKDTLEEVERVSLDALISGSEDAEGARERVKLARHLARTPERLESERARLEKILESLTEEETW